MAARLATEGAARDAVEVSPIVQPEAAELAGVAQPAEPDSPPSRRRRRRRGNSNGGGGGQAPESPPAQPEGGGWRPPAQLAQPPNQPQESEPDLEIEPYF